MKDAKTQHRVYRREIDGLRAIAVIAVIINHFDKTILPGGHLGVDIFFVISGFVITQSLASRSYTSFNKFITEFYTRRIKRLAPALVCFAGITCLLVLLFIDPQSQQSATAIRTGIASLFGLANLYLLRNATDYFGSSAELNPFTHTWSLGVEEQFYLLFPLAVWFSGYSRKYSTGSLALVVILGLTGCLSLVSYCWSMQVNQTAGFYLMPTRYWELALGSLAFLIVQWKEEKKYSLDWKNTSLPILILIVLSMGLHSLSQGVSTMLVVFLTAAFMVMYGPGSLSCNLLKIKPLNFIGLISYSLYLWHWSVITISRWTIGVHWWTIPFQILFIFVLSVLSYYYIEQPLRKHDWPTFRKGRFTVSPIGYALLSLACCSALIFFVTQGFKERLYTGNRVNLVKTGVKTLTHLQEYQGKVSWRGEQCVLSTNGEVGKQIDMEDCTFGDFETMDRRFLVIGDSFSAAELEMYKVLPDNDIGAVTITACWESSPVPEIENKGFWSKANDYYWESVIPGMINELRRGDILVMVYDGSFYSPKKSDKANDDKLRKLRAGLSRMAEEFSEKGLSIIYQSANPFMREANCTPETALTQWWDIRDDSPCHYYTRQETLARRQSYHNILTELQSKHSNFYVLDLFEVFCPEEVCTFTNKEGIFLYRDEWSHPSVEANIIAQPLFLETVLKSINNTNRPLDKIIQSRPNL